MNFKSKLDGLGVLLIEENESDALRIKSFLSPNSAQDVFMKVTHITSISKLETTVQGCSFDVILLGFAADQIHPVRIVSEVLNWCHRFPIVVLSDIEELNLRIKILQAGAQEYLCKSELSKNLLFQVIVNSMERKSCQSILQKSEAMKRILFEKSLDAIVILNEKGNMKELNAAACHLFEQTEPQLQGNSLKEFLSNRKSEGLGPLFENSNFGKRVEGHILGIHGQVVPVEAYTIELPIEKNHLYTVFIRDISKHKKDAQELKKAKELADLANKSKSMFLANMSHEIRTPLGIVLSYSELLSTPQIQETERKEYIEAIQRNGNLLQKLVEDILDISKIESGKIQFKIEKLNLRKLIDQLRHDISPKVKAKGLFFDIQISKNIPDYITTDLLRLLQILYNIIGNAIKFTHEGKIELLIDCEVPTSCKTNDRPSNCDKMIFLIRDTGLGISEEEQSRLFQIFNQASSYNVDTQGTGLGLVISKKLAKLMGGDVILKESHLGLGSAFEVSVATDLSQESNIETLTADPQDEITHQVSKKTYSNLKIFIAEDSLDNQNILNKYLSQEKISVDLVSNGKEAIKNVWLKDYDLVLMDLRMPIMGGQEAVIQLRSLGYKKPIIALTAMAFDSEKEQCLKAGFNDFITKPIDRKKTF